MKHYQDEYTNRAIIECDNPSELRALFLVLMGDYVDNIAPEYQEKIAHILNKPFISGGTRILILALQVHYNINVILKEFNVMLDL